MMKNDKMTNIMKRIVKCPSSVDEPQPSVSIEKSKITVRVILFGAFAQSDTRFSKTKTPYRATGTQDISKSSRRTGRENGDFDTKNFKHAVKNI